MGSTEPVQFGKSLRDLFPFDSSWRNLNHGSFGSVPKVIKAKQAEHQSLAESFPDKYIRYDYPTHLDASRVALAKHLNCPVDTLVLVTNATTAVNTVLRNLTWNADGLDEIISFSTIYGACGKTIDYVVDSTDLVASRVITLTYPLEDDEIVALFRNAVEQSLADDRRPRVAVLDAVSSQPGVRFPFEAVAAACQELGILSLLDAAQGVGMLDLDLSAVDVDFATSNCHKWLHVPRPCGFLYVPARNQHLMASTLPTSHGYTPKGGEKRNKSLLPADESKTPFVKNFQFVGTLDTSPYPCVKHSLEWRETVLGGEKRIREYIWWLAKEGGKRAAEILGTHVLDNQAGTLTNCAMVNIWLPIREGDVKELTKDTTGIVVPAAESASAALWAAKCIVDDYNSFIALSSHNGRWYTRLSAQVYLELEDFEWAARTLKEVCEKVGEGKYKEPA